jgi:hypothetical protein
VIYGVDLSATSDATLGSASLVGPKLSLSFPEVQKRILLKKGLNFKKLGFEYYSLHPKL